MVTLKLLAGAVATVLLVLAFAACGGGRSESASSTLTKEQKDRIALEELDYAEVHNNNRSGCVAARTWRRERARSGQPGTEADKYMLRSAERTCAYWHREQRENRGKVGH